MGEIEPYALNIALEVLKILGGVLVPVLTIIVTVYAKKFENKMKRKAIQGEIDRLTLWADQANSFKLMSAAEKADTVLDTVRLFALESGIAISDSELLLMIDRSMQSLVKLQMTGLKLMKLKREVNDECDNSQ